VDLLWSPWRYDYIKGCDKNAAPASTGCVFCDILANPATDEEKFILHRAGFNFVILNIFPYITGHLMIVPFAHLAELAELPKEASDEMMDLTKKCQSALRNVYNPEGFNVGMNIGKAAGAGVAGHLHQHIMPRWFGDVNFITSIGETRTLPESLEVTFERVKSVWSR
jgi:ATP adenylyltransferase